MIQKKSKREIWRESSSVLIRFIYALRYLFLYLKYILLVVYSKRIVMILSNVKSWKIHDELLRNIYEEWIEAILALDIFTKPVVITSLIIIVLIGIAFTIWYHIRKGIVASFILYVKDCCRIIFYVYGLCRYPIYHMYQITIFIFLLFLTLVDFRIARSIYVYNRKLEENKLHYEKSLQQNGFKSRYLANYKFTKSEPDQPFQIEKMARNSTKDEKKIKIDKRFVDGDVHNIYGSTEKSQKVKPKDGMVVDTSLGYRRITFEDIE